MKVLIVIALLFALPAEAQVVKCVNANGKVSYQDRPCPGDAKGSWVRTRTQSETHGGEPAAAIMNRAAAHLIAEERARNAAIAAAQQGQSQAPSSGSSPSCPQTVSNCPYRRR